jgi:hypothetical protein
VKNVYLIVRKIGSGRDSYYYGNKPSTSTKNSSGNVNSG